MDPLSIIGLGTSVAGGLGQAFGGFLSGKSEREAARKQRKLLADFYAKSEANVTATSREERERALKYLSQAQRTWNREYQWAQQRADAEVFNALASPAYQEYSGFIQDMFTKGVPDTLANEYANRMRTAQSMRGLAEGGAAAMDEAAMLTNLAHQGRMQLLPSLQQLATTPLQMRQQALSTLLQQRAGAQGMGLADFQAAMQGLGGAAQITGALTNPLMQLGGSLYGQMPYSATNPLAALLGGASSTIGSVGSGLFGLGLLNQLKGGKVA